MFQRVADNVLQKYRRLQTTSDYFIQGRSVWRTVLACKLQ